MARHVLFLLNPGFFDGNEGPYFCPHSASLQGLLAYVPDLEARLDVRRVDFSRPRADIVALLGEENQNTPVLVIDDSEEAPPEAQVSATTGRAFIVGDIAIGDFLHGAMGIMRPH